MWGKFPWFNCFRYYVYYLESDLEGDDGRNRVSGRNDDSHSEDRDEGIWYTYDSESIYSNDNTCINDGSCDRED